jgi:hypothetical protein
MKLVPLFLLIGFAGSTAAARQQADQGDRLVAAIDTNRIRAHLAVLAHDSLEGRGPGSRGGRKAAEYIAARFQELGLSPAGDSGRFFQYFTITDNDGGHSIAARNVAGLLRGAGPDADQVVVIGGHYDHLGIGPAVNGDSIYNGAEDNAGGVAQLLALAEAFAKSGVRPRRSLLFLAFDAEELGLLGAGAFVRRPTIPLDRQVAMINFDAANLYGETRDIAALGLRESTLDGVFRRAARAEGLVVPPSQPDSIEAFFFRSDQFPFARAGVPAIFPFVGWDFVGRNPAWAMDQWNRYFADRYHLPSDQLQTWFSMRGALQQVRVVARAVMEVANADEPPAWNPGSRFHRP